MLSFVVCAFEPLLRMKLIVFAETVTGLRVEVPRRLSVCHAQVSPGVGNLHLEPKLIGLLPKYFERAAYVLLRQFQGARGVIGLVREQRLASAHRTKVSLDELVCSRELSGLRRDFLRERCRVRPDAERKHGHGCEAGILQHLAESV